MRDALLNSQYKMTPTAAELLVLKAMKPKKTFAECQNKADYACYILNQPEYKEKMYCGFILAEESPDLLHTFAAIVGIKHVEGNDFDFSVFMRAGDLAKWQMKK